MGKFTLTRKAKDDLKSIAAYTQRKWGKEQRKIYIKQFDSVFHMLVENPSLGNECDYIKAGYRKLFCASHFIFYRSITESHIEIVRILHKRMDVTKNFTTP